MSNTFVIDNLRKDVERLQNQKTQDEIEREKVDKLVLDNIQDFVVRYVKHPKGRPQEEWFQQREYLTEIYNSLENVNNIIIVKGRQMEISEFAVNLLLYYPLKHPGKYVYSSSTLDKSSIFNKDRFRKQLVNSPILNRLAPEQQVGRVKYGESELYFKSTFEDMDTLRSFPGDMLILDEFQDAEADALPVATSMLTHSDFKKLVIIGTPKEAGTFFDRYWSEKSDRREWNKETKAWVPSDTEGKDITFSGYHISQELAIGKWMTQKEFDKHVKDTLSISKMLLMNEVYGVFFAGPGRIITPHLMWSTFDPTFEMKQYLPGEPLYAGVDWGVGKKADTVFWALKPVLLELPDVWRFDTVYIERINFGDITQHFERVLELCKSIPLKAVVCDWGEGMRNNQDLFKVLGEKIISCQGVTRPLKPMEVIPTPFGYTLQLDKTYAIDCAFDTILKGKFRMYNERDSVFKEWIINNFTCMYPEVTEANGRKIWKKDADLNNDALMAYIYALFAFEINKQSFSYENPMDYIKFV